MEGIFVKLLNMSVSASGFILIAVLLRALLKRSPKWIHCLLWGLVAVRLVCPLSFESSFSLAPRADFVETKLGVQREDGRYMNSATDAGKALNDDLDNAQNKNLANKGNADKQSDWKKISWTWFVGVVLLLGYAAISYLRFRKKVQASVRLRDGIYVCDNIRTPFILGVIRPGI